MVRQKLPDARLEHAVVAEEWPAWRSELRVFVTLANVRGVDLEETGG